MWWKIKSGRSLCNVQVVNCVYLLLCSLLYVSLCVVVATASVVVFFVVVVVVNVL